MRSQSANTISERARPSRLTRCRGTARRWAVATGTSFLAACGAGSTTDPRSGQLEFVGGDHIVDTALAQPAQAIVVGITGAGSGIQMAFEAVPSPLGGQYTSLAGLASSQWDAAYADTTNTRGQLGARVWLGSKAGDHYVRIRVPARSLVDSVRITVEPANLARLSADPSHSTVILGGEITIQVGTSDSYGNERKGDQVALRPLDNVTTTSGRVVRGANFGVSTIEVAAANQKGNIYVSVAPDAKLSGINPQGVGTIRSDAKNLDVIVPMSFPIYGIPNRASWLPNGSALVFDNYGMLYWARKDRTWLRLTDGTEAANSPTVSGDGQWIYYARQTSGTWRIHRIKPDATGDELFLADQVPLTWPTISPNGQYLAYVAGESELRVRDLSAGATRVLHSNGATPTWSPNSQQLAFVCGDRICIAARDGSTVRFVGDPNRYNPGTEWSPDGRWLLAFNFAPQLIDLTTGAVIAIYPPLGLNALTWAR